jgi:hypothetical protein
MIDVHADEYALCELLDDVAAAAANMTEYVAALPASARRPDGGSEGVGAENSIWVSAPRRTMRWSRL